MKKQLKEWIDANVHDGEDRSGCNKDRIIFTPDELQELINELYDDVIKPRLDEQLKEKGMSKERYLEQEINKDLRILELERQLKEARETEKKAFWSGFEIARMNPDFNDIQAHWGNHLKLKKHNEQLKEQGE